MSTIAELIDNVTSLYSRPDLEEQLLAYGKTAIYCAHKTDKFARDLASVNIVGFSQLNGKVTVSIPISIPRLREIRNIKLFSAYTGVDPNIVPTATTELIASPDYQDLNQMNSDRNYFGLKYLKLYSIAGTLLNIQGVESNATCIQINGLFLPTYTYNTLTLLWETNSWIMTECPELVEAYIRVRCCEILADEKKQRVAQQNLLLQRRDILATYVSELLR